MKRILFLFVSIWLFVTYSCKDPDPVTEPHTPTPVTLDIPKHLPDMIIPADNPTTKEGIELGRFLFYEKMLSGDNTMSCATCHVDQDGFSDKRQFSIGIDGSVGRRQAMPIINVGWLDKLFWDGRALGVEDQALKPVEDPIEMKADWEDVVVKLQNSAPYPDMFHKAFGSKTITKENAVKAIAQFERTMISANSKFDDVLFYEKKGLEMTDDELEGYDLFYQEGADCFHCHSGSLLTDQLFHNNGLDEFPEDIGLEEVTGNPKDRGLFRTPTLRNIALTAPYMHDGRFNTLEEVIDHYSEGIHNSETIDPLMEFAHQGGIHLTDDEKRKLLAFLHTFTDTTFIKNPAFMDPFK